MRTRQIFLIVLCLLPFALSAQTFTYSKSDIITSKSPVTIRPAQITQDYMPQLIHLEVPAPGGKSYQSFLLRQKELIRTDANRKTGGTVNLGDAQKPVVLSGFRGNDFDGRPTDNHIAISNDGIIVSVANSTIFIYDPEADTVMKKISLQAFFDTLHLPADKYDPRVVYDPGQDRFILACLSGRDDSTSNVMVAFSLTNNPLDEWNLYALPGNPLNDSSWTDFPTVAITDEELFITVNLMNNDTVNSTANDRWKFLFRQSLIWQINKQRGYNRQPLEMRYYNDIFYDSRPIRNLCPIQGGSATYGPEIYILSNRNFDLVNDTFFILEVTGLLDDPQTYLQINVRQSEEPYGLAPDGKQRLNRVLQTNDSRVLAGYLEDDQIHFVQNTVNPDTARSAIYHGIITSVGSSKIISGNIIGIPSMDFAYPNISYTGKYPGDDEALITFDHTSVDTFPGFSAVFYNGREGYSERVTLKAGTNFADASPVQRWGDYSGSQRKYNEPGKVWAAGFYGERLGINLSNSTWIAEIASPDTSTQPPVSIASVVLNSPTAYPNPASDRFTLEFQLTADEILDISLFDFKGSLVKTLIRDRVKSGRNRFSFSTSPLSAGVYFLRITDGKGCIANEKIVRK